MGSAGAPRPALGSCLVPAIGLGLALASWPGCGCSGGEPEPAAETHAVPQTETPTTAHIGGRGFNVLFVSVDTTRADHLGCYGHPQVKTPNIDRFAAEGTRFAWCISSAPLTLPSHATMLTGSYPFLHGARDNGFFKLAEENVTLTELFKEAGYATHAEVAALVLNHKYGLDQGFDSYGDVEPEQHEVRARKPARSADLDSSETGELEVEPEPHVIAIERDAEEITTHGIELLREQARRDEPFFIFLHYFDPHFPHDAPERFTSAYEDGYYAEIAYFDEQFGRLMDAVGDLGIADKTLVILTSDHGEGRGEHGEFTHSSFLYDSTLHVPLIMWCPGQIPAGQVVSTQVRLLDLAPTVVDFARLPRTAQMQGTSLLGVLAEPTLDMELPCYAETMVPKTMFGYSQLRALRTNDWKYILAPRAELYEVAEDRLEVFNKAMVETERADAMRQELREIIADSPPPPGSRGAWRSMDAMEMRRMAALGYVSSTLTEDPTLTSGSELDYFEPLGINPRDRIEVVECMSSGLGAFRMGRYDLAEKIFQRFMELEPDNPVGPSYLGRTYTILEREDEAVEMLRRAVELRPAGYVDQRMLGKLLVKRREFDEAERCFRLASEYNPNDHESRINRGMILAAQERYDDALAEYNAVLTADAEMPRVHFLKGAALRRSGLLDQAVTSLTEAVRLDPRLVPAHEELATAHLQAGATDQAIAHLTGVIGEIPDAPRLQHKLGECHAAVGDTERAGQCFARVVELLPESAVAQQNLGTNLLVRGHAVAAIEHLRKALELRPEFPGALFYLGGALVTRGELDEAAQTYERLIDIAPWYGEAYPRAAALREGRGDPAGAIELLQRGHELVPDHVGIANDLAWFLATCPVTDLRDGERAVRLAEYASGLMGGESCLELDTLAAAYAEAGRFDEAIATAEHALAIASQSDPALAAQFAPRLELYRRHQPYHEP